MIRLFVQLHLSLGKRYVLILVAMTQIQRFQGDHKTHVWQSILLAVGSISPSIPQENWSLWKEVQTQRTTPHFTLLLLVESLLFDVFGHQILQHRV